MPPTHPHGSGICSEINPRKEASAPLAPLCQSFSFCKKQNPIMFIGRNVNASLKTRVLRGARVAQSVERPTLDFGSGRDSGAVGSSPMSASALIMVPD